MRMTRQPWLSWTFARLGRGFVVSLGVVLGACSAPSTPSSPTPSTIALTLRTGERLAVIGLQQGEASRDSLSPREPWVGFGLTLMLTDSLCEFGRFRCVEEKEVHQRELLADLV